MSEQKPHPKEPLLTTFAGLFLFGSALLAWTLTLVMFIYKLNYNFLFQTIWIIALQIYVWATPVGFIFIIAALLRDEPQRILKIITIATIIQLAFYFNLIL